MRCFTRAWRYSLWETGNQIREERLNFDKPLIALQIFRIRDQNENSKDAATLLRIS